LASPGGSCSAGGSVSVSVLWSDRCSFMRGVLLFV
jgi:hypothetical protein